MPSLRDRWRVVSLFPARHRRQKGNKGTVMPIEFEDIGADPGAIPEMPQNGQAPETAKWQAILDAPEYTSLLKGRPSAEAREYQERVNSILKETLKYRLGAGTISGLADVSAILAYGPDFAERTGVLAAHDDKAKKAIDMLTAPDNPWVLFAFAALPLIGQVLRNHDEDVTRIRRGWSKEARAERRAQKETRAVAPKPKIRLFKREITLPFRLRIKLSLFRPNSVEPQVLINQVMGSDKVRKAIHEKYGVKIASAAD